MRRASTQPFILVSQIRAFSNGGTRAGVLQSAVISIYNHFFTARYVPQRTIGVQTTTGTHGMYARCEGCK